MRNCKKCRFNHGCDRVQILTPAGKCKKYGKYYDKENQARANETKKQWREDNKEHIKQWCEDNKEHVTYSIVCSITGQIYFGSTCQYGKRIQSHKKSLCLGTHYNKPLQQAYNQQGAEAFSYKLLKIHPDKETARQAELHLFDTHSNLFNMKAPGW